MEFEYPFLYPQFYHDAPPMPELLVPTDVVQIAPDWYVVEFSNRERIRVAYLAAQQTAQHLGRPVRDGRH